MKSFKIVPFAVLQKNCCERHFTYMGRSGMFDVKCHEQGFTDNVCDIKHCPQMKMIGNFNPISFDQFQNLCANRKFKPLKNEGYFVTCSEQDSNENRCNFRQCPVWNKECFSVEEFEKKQIERQQEQENFEEYLNEISVTCKPPMLSMRELTAKMNDN